ncbi:MAG TPA: type II toxin-antitoxin system Phd/YefM family antitoxin [Syntrophorhabdales bacterium]|nr:type II toxin-antitoxin system Phd/YefM family antitoxin [Syntrophorhabdales bacterium]
MKLSDAVKPISYIKAHTSEVIRDVVQNQGTIVITLNGEAKAVLQDIREFEKTQESLALLKILAMSKKSLENGKFRPAREAFRDLRGKIKGLGDR